jgi:hypothetical protein
LLKHAQSKLSERVQILLNGSVYNAEAIFRVVNIQNPVHGFHCPFHPGMMKQLQLGISLLFPSTLLEANVIPNSEIWALMIVKGLSSLSILQVERTVFPSNETVRPFRSSASIASAHFIRHLFCDSGLISFSRLSSQ